MKKLLFVLLAIHGIACYSQRSEKGTVKIYRGAVAGADVDFRMYSDSTYEIEAVKFWCSLCNFDSLAMSINQKGHWVMVNDSIKIVSRSFNGARFFKKIHHSTLMPLFSIDQSIYEVSVDSLKNALLKRIVGNKIYNFELIYETYNNGFPKRAKYKIGNKNKEYWVNFINYGEVENIQKYKNGKPTFETLK